MNQFQSTKLDEARDRHPLGVKSEFHSSVENGDLVGIIYKHTGVLESGKLHEPYFYEIYDSTHLIGMGGGGNLQPKALTELIAQRLKAIDLQRTK